MLSMEVPRPKPRKEPSVAITLWQGIMMGKGLRAIHWPAALEAFAFPTRAASQPYVRVSPYGISLHADRVVRLKPVGRSREICSWSNDILLPLK